MKIIWRALLVMTLLVTATGCAAAAVDVAAVPNIQGPIVDIGRNDFVNAAAGLSMAIAAAYTIQNHTAESAAEFERNGPTVQVGELTLVLLAVPFVVPGLGDVTMGDYNHIESRHGAGGLAAFLFLSMPETQCRECLDGRMKCFTPTSGGIDAFGVFGFIRNAATNAIEAIYVVTALMDKQSYVDNEMRNNCP